MLSPFISTCLLVQLLVAFIGSTLAFAQPCPDEHSLAVGLKLTRTDGQSEIVTEDSSRATRTVVGTMGKGGFFLRQIPIDGSGSDLIGSEYDANFNLLKTDVFINGNDYARSSAFSIGASVPWDGSIVTRAYTAHPELIGKTTTVSATDKVDSASNVRIGRCAYDTLTILRTRRFKDSAPIMQTIYWSPVLKLVLRGTPGVEYASIDALDGYSEQSAAQAFEKARQDNQALRSKFINLPLTTPHPDMRNCRATERQSFQPGGYGPVLYTFMQYDCGDRAYHAHGLTFDPLKVTAVVEGEACVISCGSKAGKCIEEEMHNPAFVEKAVSSARWYDTDPRACADYWNSFSALLAADAAIKRERAYSNLIAAKRQIDQVNRVDSIIRACPAQPEFDGGPWFGSSSYQSEALRHVARVRFTPKNNNFLDDDLQMLTGRRFLCVQKVVYVGDAPNMAGARAARVRLLGTQARSLDTAVVEVTFPY